MAPSGVPTALLALTGVLLWMRRGSMRAAEDDVQKETDSTESAAVETLPELATVDAADLTLQFADTVKPAVADEVEEATMECADRVPVRRACTTGSDGTLMVALLEADLLPPNMCVAEVADAVEQGAEDEKEATLTRKRKITSLVRLETHWVANGNAGSTGC